MRALFVVGTCGALLLAAVVGGGCARPARGIVYAQPEGAQPGAQGGSGGGVRVAVDLEMRVGNPRGHIQIPKGGQPGTTSPDRPTYEELGVDLAWAPVLDVKVALGCHRLRLGAAYWFLHGEETLRQPLTSHEDFYPAGTDVTSSSAVGEGWFSYGYALPVSRAVTVTPALGIYSHHIMYEMGGGGNTSDRDFRSFSPMFETEAEWRPGGRMRVSALLRLVLDDALGLSSPTNVVDAQVRWHWDLSRNAGLHLAVGATSISHHDEQTVPNDILLEVLPWFGLGGEFRF